uniref:Uncharacterized protein n=1 Tax=Steinernema glaseri TaxID=37863 RepID=A0A1I7ZUY5_9BILA
MSPTMLSTSSGRLHRSPVHTWSPNLALLLHGLRLPPSGRQDARLHPTLLARPRHRPLRPRDNPYLPAEGGRQKKRRFRRLLELQIAVSLVRATEANSPLLGDHR